jgi:hypothetical protein
MRYQLLGPSGLRVSELCLGTMSFGGAWGFGADLKESHRVLEGFAEAGDPNAARNARKNLRASVEASLRRLRTDYLDLLWVQPDRAQRRAAAAPGRRLVRPVGVCLGADGCRHSDRQVHPWPLHPLRRQPPCRQPGPPHGAEPPDRPRGRPHRRPAWLDLGSGSGRLDQVSRIEFGFPNELLRGPWASWGHGDLEPQIELPVTAPSEIAPPTGRRPPSRVASAVGGCRRRQREDSG